jgi:bifunctional non-homologous end joining protein LigD
VPSNLVLAESVPDAGSAMIARARDAGWEGVIAKRIDAPYEPGTRSRAWLKLKIEHRQEFVVGGYTEPRNTRQHIGALLLGYFDGERFIYVGHTGGGFTQEALREMHGRLAPLERRTSPFEETPRTNERAHWVTPKIVVEIKFSEWTSDGKLRQPIYLGTRDDKNAREVGREPESLAGRTRSSRQPRRRTGAVRRRPAAVIAQLERIEKDTGAGVVTVGRKNTVRVSSLGKVFFPGDGYTKGDLMRYYAEVAPALLPAVKDRPLVLRRFPNGIKGTSFYQQNAPDEAPESVRIETIRNGDGEEQRRLVGGDLATLLYTIQLGAISVDPWHGRLGSLEYADYTILDLDPGPRAPFSRVVEVARLVRSELDALGLRGIAKTSGASGIHVFVPLPAKTPEDAARLVAQLIASRIAGAHPREATVERTVKARPPSTVYVDYLQNIRSKTVAGVYAVRARAGAPVSTPLRWEELTRDLDPREFTIETVPKRLATAGDLWGPAMRVRNSLDGVLALTADENRPRARGRNDR